MSFVHRLRDGVDTNRTIFTLLGSIPVLGLLLIPHSALASSVPYITGIYIGGLFANTVNTIRNRTLFRYLRALWSAAFGIFLVVLVPYAFLVAMFIKSAEINHEFLALLIMGFVPLLLEGGELSSWRISLG